MGKKITNKHFADWHSDVLGYGYGSGEEFWIPALHELFAYVAARKEHAYNYQDLENLFGGLAAWLLINTLARAEIFDYGTSPRFGWLSPKGELLATYINSHTAEELAFIIGDFPSDEHCLRGWCNETGSDVNCNPLFGRH